MYRKSFVEINLNNLKYNINRIINSIPGYKYYFGVCKADAYGHGIKAIETIINSGCNYLAVATLDEALEIRTINNDIPILCLGIIDKEYINICSKNDITITISNLNYIKSLKKDKKLKVHIKINTGMNRLGVNNKKEFNKIYSIAKNNFILEGLYKNIKSI